MFALVGPPGLEPGTSALSGQRSNRTELWARNNLTIVRAAMLPAITTHKSRYAVGMSSRDWDQRYEAKELVWSAEPNQFLPPAVDGLPPGRALDLAAGEGRNAIWLAAQGWAATAVDFSAEGVKKGRLLAEEAGVSVEWVVADVTAYSSDEPFDLIVVFYAHLPPEAFTEMMAMARAALAPGGKIFGVGHALRNLADGVGGPQHPAILWDADLVSPTLQGLGDVMVEEIERQTESGVAIDLRFEAFAPSI